MTNRESGGLRKSERFGNVLGAAKFVHVLGVKVHANPDGECVDGRVSFVENIDLPFELIRDVLSVPEGDIKSIELTESDVLHLRKVAADIPKPAEDDEWNRNNRQVA